VTSNPALPHTRRWTDTARQIAWGGLLFLAATVPVVISLHGFDIYRVPKLLYFQAGTLLIGALFAVTALYDENLRVRLARQRFPMAIASAAVIWSAVVTLLARHPDVSYEAPFRTFCYGLFFVMVASLAGQQRPLALLAVGAAILPAIVSSVYAILQSRGVPMPLITFRPHTMPRNQVVALLGNPNYVGTYLLLPVMAMLAAAVAWRRWWIGAIALLLMGGILATVTVTAIGAIGAGILALVITTPSRRVRIGAAAMILAGIVAMAAFGPARRRAVTLATDLRNGHFDTLTSLRLPAFSAAAMMFAERPLLGVGPGNFGADYLTYRLRVDEIHPEWLRFDNLSFGEVHNDHLQLLAETGVPGYLLFLLFVGRIGMIGFRRRGNSGEPEDDGQRFVRVFAFPAAFALCFGWERCD
jgi:O-antigen ligase